MYFILYIYFLDCLIEDWQNLRLHPRNEPRIFISSILRTITYFCLKKMYILINCICNHYKKNHTKYISAFQRIQWDPIFWKKYRPHGGVLVWPKFRQILHFCPFRGPTKRLLLIFSIVLMYVVINCHKVAIKNEWGYAKKTVFHNYSELSFLCQIKNDFRFWIAASWRQTRIIEFRKKWRITFL